MRMAPLTGLGAGETSHRGSQYLADINSVPLPWLAQPGCASRDRGQHLRQIRDHLHGHAHAIGHQCRGLLRVRGARRLRVDKGFISDVLVYRKEDRRRGIASALYDLIEADLGRPLVPSRIRSTKASRAFWASRNLRTS